MQLPYLALMVNALYVVYERGICKKNLKIIIDFNICALKNYGNLLGLISDENRAHDKSCGFQNLFNDWQSV